MVDVKKDRPGLIMLLNRAPTGCISDLMMELQFSGLLLPKNITWWSGLVVDVKKHIPEKVMLLKGTSTGSIIG